MISLVLLPLVCFLSMQNSSRFYKKHVVEVNMFNPDNPFGWKLPLSNKTIEIKLTGEEHWDSIRLILALKTLRDYKLSHDTSIMIHFIFEDEARYWTFVEVIDMCKRERMNFLPYDQHIWVMNQPKRKRDIQQYKLEKITPMGCGGLRYDPPSDDKPPMSFWQSKKKFLKENAGILWPASLIFMLMIFVFLRTKRSY